MRQLEQRTEQPAAPRFSPPLQRRSRRRSPNRMISLLFACGLGWAIVPWGSAPGDLAPAWAEATDPAPSEADTSSTAPAETADSPVTPLDLSDLPDPALPTRPDPATIAPPPIAPPPIAAPIPSPPTSAATRPTIQLQSGQPPSGSSPAAAVPPPPQLPTSARTAGSNGSVLVFAERSSGCEATIQLGGDIPAGLCGYGQDRPPEFQGDMPYGIAVDGLGAFGGRSQQGANYYGRSAPPPALRGLGDRAFLFPFASLVPITSSFGWRLHPLFGDWRLHTGTDFGAAWGTPVYAVQSGQVTIADFLGGYGLTVVIQGENGTQEVLYGHLSEVFVQPGQQVTQGSPIGRVGSTGNSTGPHLHLELRQWGSEGWVALDAAPYFQQSQLATAQGAPGALGLPPFGPNAGTESDIDWELQTLGAGFIDGPTPLEEMVTWLLTQLVRVQELAQAAEAEGLNGPIDPAATAPTSDPTATSSLTDPAPNNSAITDPAVTGAAFIDSPASNPASPTSAASGPTSSNLQMSSARRARN